MQGVSCQRWREGHETFRRPDESMPTLRYEVAALTRPEAVRFVKAHHYSKSKPALRFQYGLFRGGNLVGCAIYSHPCSDKVLTNAFTGEVRRAADAYPLCVELGRFVLLDTVPGNGETWMLARTFELLRREHGQVGVISFSDPVPRTRILTDETGARRAELFFPGHIGTIYQAHNGIYTGRATARTLRLLPDGTVMNARSIQKVRALERGWEKAIAHLQRYGAPALADPFDEIARRRWINEQLEALTRPWPHAGNHTYLWALNRRAWGMDAQGRRRVPPSLSRPKEADKLPEAKKRRRQPVQVAA
jgi:hypothetical protein